jgi:sugar porter (SP) family MFS transporter
VESEPLLTSQQPSTTTTTATNDTIDWTMTTLLFFFPALCGALFGYDIGATSGALLSMSSPTLSGTDWYNLSPLQSGLIVSLSLGGALIGSVAALLYGDQLGRKKELLLASSLYATASLIVAASPGGLPGVLSGRLLYGLGIGFAMHAAPAYIAETAPSKVRGLLISLKEAFIVGGILAGYATSYIFVNEVGGWRNMYACAAVPALLAFAGVYTLPESPRWLALSGAKVSDITDALIRTKGSKGSSSNANSNASLVVEREVEDIVQAMSNSPRAIKSSIFDLSEVLRPENRRPLAIGLSLMLFQQITGQPSVLYYAAKIFQAAGFGEAAEATGVSIILGTFKLIMTGVAVVTVDNWGRRPLLLYGVSALTASLLFLAAASSSTLGLPDGLAAWTNLGALLIYVGAYQVSFGPISWLLVGEVFPLKVRGQAIALASLTNFGSNFLVSLLLPSVQEMYGPASTYLIFSLIGMVAVVVIYKIVPETKGKSLEEIEALWKHDDQYNV